jgi:AraC family transcriptional regulator of arabinose operon
VERCLRPHGFDLWLLHYSFAGHARFGLPDGDRLLGPGEALIYRPGTPQDYDAVRPWSFFWAVFRPRAEWHELLGWPELAPGVLWLGPVRGTTRKRIEASLAEAHRLATSALPRRRALALNALEAALLWWDVQNDERKSLDPRIVGAIEHVARNLDARLGVGDLARVAHLSPSRFSHLFREQVGAPPRLFVEQQRLERAKHLLELTTLPVHVVAAQVGFASPFHFATRFRKVIGTSPRGYRAASRRSTV